MHATDEDSLASTARRTTVSEIKRTSFWILLLLVSAFVFLDYWTYSQQFRLHPESIAALADGTGLAPAQYRVGVIYAAKLILQLSRGHLSYRHSFAIFDFIFTLAASLLARSVLLRTQAFLQATAASQWLRLFVVLGLAAYYFNWSLWYQRPETWASTLFVVCSMWFLSSVRSAPVLVSGLTVLAILQGAVRADVAIIFHFALFVYVLLRGAQGFPAGKGALLIASFLGGLLPTAILWVVMHKVFPHATYGDTAVVQIVKNLSPSQFFPALLFLVPTFYTFARSSLRDKDAKGPAAMLLFGSFLYFISWATVGRLEEVRIFVPFAFALMPQTANVLVNRIEG